ncbi:N-formylglutamate amidohydrolase [Paenibacillus sp. GP183]|uniref:N-formylglutamate amidohydrolase n=1 Tax=Paenibacillus sp. GP183 TaxID=1882751 RepID=UPI000B84B3AA
MFVKVTAVCVSANFSRYVIDVNRDISFKNHEDEYTTSLVYHKSTFGKEIYDTSLSEDAILNRIKTVYVPYDFRFPYRIIELNYTTRLPQRWAVSLSYLAG